MASALRRLRLLLGGAWQADPARTVGLMLTAPVQRVSPLLGALAVKVLVDGLVTGDDGRTTGAAVSAGVLAAVAFGANRVATRLSTTLAEETTAWFERRMVALAASIPGVDHFQDPEYMDHLEQLRFQPAALGWGSSSILGSTMMVFQAVVLAALLLSVTPLLLALPVAGGIIAWTNSRSGKAHATAMARSAEDRRRANHFFELATAPAWADEVRTLAVGPALLARHDRAWADSNATFLRADIRSAIELTAAGLIFAAVYVGTLAFVVHRGLQGEASPGDVALTVIVAGLVSQQITALIGLFGGIVRGMLLADKFLWLVDYAARQRSVSDGSAAPARLHHDIRFEGVTFAYPASASPVFRDLDLVLPSGTVIAIIGDNGVGKSTLVKLLTGMHTPTAGRIVVDGTPLPEFALADWRAVTAGAFQDFARFELVLQESVGTGDLPHIDDPAAVREALARAGADGLIDDLSGGLGTPLGASLSDGLQLSGGQWQKIALGRAMMRTAPLLLVFDEPTASLDPDAERALFSRWSEHARRAGHDHGTITVLVSHRFTSVRMADLIVVLDNDGVREVGTHDDLVSRGGLYAELFALQAAGYQ